MSIASSTTSPSCVSAGRNHLRFDLGIDRDDPRLSLYAFRDAVERRIDYATVGDRLFVNNVSLGVYASIVQQEGYRDAKAEVTKAALPEMLGRTQEPFDLQFTEPDGSVVDGALSSRCRTTPTCSAHARRRPNAGTSTRARSGSSRSRRPPGPRRRGGRLSALGQRRRSRHWHEFTTERFEVRSRSGRAYAGVDGEARARHPARVRDPPAGAPPPRARGKPHRGRTPSGA
jgi:hypothetical protein